jgi:hypothetical protein
MTKTQKQTKTAVAVAPKYDLAAIRAQVIASRKKSNVGAGAKAQATLRARYSEDELKRMRIEAGRKAAETRRNNENAAIEAEVSRLVAELEAAAKSGPAPKGASKATNGKVSKAA